MKNYNTFHFCLLFLSLINAILLFFCCRSEAFDETDDIKTICDSSDSCTAAVDKINGSNGGGCSDPSGCTGIACKMTSEANSDATTAGSTSGKPGSKMISSFVTVIEGTKDLSLHEEKQRSPQRPRPAAMATSEDELFIGMKNLICT